MKKEEGCASLFFFFFDHIKNYQKGKKIAIHFAQAGATRPIAPGPH